jgi:hypothetical protein
MANCLLCSAKCEYEEGYFGYHLSGWINLKISSIENETIFWHNIHLCDKCVPNINMILNKLNVKNPQIS